MSWLATAELRSCARGLRNPTPLPAETDPAEQVAILRDALRFYADPASYLSSGEIIVRGRGARCATLDFGAAARRALLRCGLR